MPEEITKTAETTEASVSETDKDADIGQENDGVNDADFTDDGAGTPEAEKGNDQKQDNSANARGIR